MTTITLSAPFITAEIGGLKARLLALFSREAKAAQATKATSQVDVWACGARGL